MKTKKHPEYHCPQCKKLIKFDANNPFRPFCSDRCKTIDLGNWASESYKIPATGQEDLNDSFSIDENESDQH